MCVSHLETSDSALEKFNDVVFEKNFKFFATFFVRNFPLGFQLDALFSLICTVSKVPELALLAWF